MPTSLSKNHKNSHRVWIKRRGTFLEGIQTGAVEFMSMSKKSIGSYFANKMGNTIGTGLLPYEEDLLMPRVLAMSKDAVTFRERVANHFASMSTPIPYGIGREFEIGLTEDNDEPVSTENLPLDLGDFIRYRHAINHPDVALSESLVTGDQTKGFFVYDPEEAQAGNNIIRRDKDTALVMYLEIKKVPEKVDMMLTLLGKDPRKITGKDVVGQKADALRILADTQPDTFISTYKQDHFEERSLIKSMLNTGVMKQVGTAIVDGETSTTLGHGVLEVVAYLKDPANTDMLTMFKVRLQEAMKAKIVTEKAAPELITGHKTNKKTTTKAS